MLHLQPGGPMAKSQLKARNTNPLQLGMSFIIHITAHSSSAKILFFYWTKFKLHQPNLMVDKGVDLSLNSNCNLHIKYWKLILNIKYPSLYECLFCDYDKASVEGIKKSIESVSWELTCSNKSAHKQISTFDKTLMNIFSSITPNKLIIFNDRNTPPPPPPPTAKWVNNFVKSKINGKTNL